MSLEKDFVQKLDLRGTPCPVNFIKCRLALELLKPDDCLLVDLDRGEPELMVIPGLTNEGHKIEIIIEDMSWIRLRITSGAA